MTGLLAFELAAASFSTCDHASSKLSPRLVAYNLHETCTLQLLRLTHVSLATVVWRGRWEQCVGDDYEEAQQMPDAQQSSAPAPSGNANMASYQFQIRARPPGGPWRNNLLLSLAVGKTTVTSSMFRVWQLNSSPNFVLCIRCMWDFVSD